ncbi:MAG: Rrf2 family transcriptional regulator [Actinomycetota bacterium]|nr:MAG: Rrf2 family transcriptional regulator [Actinomycetota bacterium]
MKLITREIDYAVRALIYLAANRNETVTVPELVDELGITRPFLRKIMQLLAKAGVIESYKGNKGGFRLIKKPGDIYLIDLIEIFQGKFSLNECLLNKDICPNKGNCILKDRVDDIEEKVKKELESIDLKSLVKK